MADEVSDTESIARSVQKFDGPNTENLIFLATKMEDNMIKKKNETKANKSGAKKHAYFSDEIFDYIHMISCCRLFLLA